MQKLQDRIESRLDRELEANVTDYLKSSFTPYRFQNQTDLQKHLAEGALLQVNTISARSLAIPSGEYVVWTTDAGHTLLVPTKAPTPGSVYPRMEDKYDVLTSKILSNWNKLERVLAESESEMIGSQIDMSTVDRMPIATAIADRGLTVTQLAHECGVDPPAISRILRRPRDTATGDPGGRNPSMELASKICAVLRLDPKAAFPDFFRVDPAHKARNTPGNRGSGDVSRLGESRTPRANVLSEAVRPPKPDAELLRQNWQSEKRLRSTAKPSAATTSQPVDHMARTRLAKEFMERVAAAGLPANSIFTSGGIRRAWGPDYAMLLQSKVLVPSPHGGGYELEPNLATQLANGKRGWMPQPRSESRRRSIGSIAEMMATGNMSGNLSGNGPTTAVSDYANARPEELDDVEANGLETEDDDIDELEDDVHDKFEQQRQQAMRPMLQDAERDMSQLQHAWRQDQEQDRTTTGQSLDSAAANLTAVLRGLQKTV